MTVEAHEAKHTVRLVKCEVGKEEFATVSPDGDGVFHIAKQMDRTNQDIVGENCVCIDAGVLALTDKDKMEAWVEHNMFGGSMLNLNGQATSSLRSLQLMPPASMSTTLIRKTLSKMKCSKAAGPSGITAEMLKAAGEWGVELARQLTDAVFSYGVVPSDWEESFILNLYKGEGKALDCSNCHGLKHTGQVMKLLEWVLDFYIHEMVNVNKTQFGFVPSRGTTDAIFFVRQLQDKFIAINKLFYFASVNLEKTFDQVPRKGLWWALRSLGIEE